MVVLTTREKIRYQARGAFEGCETILEHLKKLDELADGKSEYVTTVLPSVVRTIYYLKEVLVKFREGL